MRISDWSSDVCSSDLVDDAEGRQRAWQHAKHIGHSVGRHEAKPAARADLRVQSLEVECSVLMDREEEYAVLLVLEEQVFGECPGHLPPKRLSLFDRRMGGIGKRYV